MSSLVGGSSACAAVIHTSRIQALATLLLQVLPIKICRGMCVEVGVGVDLWSSPQHSVLGNFSNVPFHPLLLLLLLLNNSPQRERERKRGESNRGRERA